MSFNRSFSFEPLEDRRLMSVSAATFVGPQTLGTTWVYQLQDAAQFTTTYKVVGLSKVGAVAAATHIHESNNVSASAYSEIYQTADSRHGVQVYKQTDTGPGETTVTSNSPALQMFPKSIAAGQVVSGTYTRTQSFTLNKKNTVSTSKHTVTIALKSESRYHISTPAGNFAAYEVVIKDTNTSVKGSYIETAYYVAPGFGTVKTVQIEVNPGSAKSTTTQVLQSFKAGK